LHNNIVAKKEGVLTKDEVLERNIKQYKAWIEMYLPPDGEKVEFSISEKEETINEEEEKLENDV